MCEDLTHNAGPVTETDTSYFSAGFPHSPADVFCWHPFDLLGKVCTLTSRHTQRRCRLLDVGVYGCKNQRPQRAKQPFSAHTHGASGCCPTVRGIRTYLHRLLGNSLRTTLSRQPRQPRLRGTRQKGEREENGEENRKTWALVRRRCEVRRVQCH